MTSVWYYQDRQTTDWAGQGLSLLTPEEQARYADFGAPGKQREYLIGRLLLKQILAKVLAVPPQSVHWQINENGKPYFADHPYQFNLTHSYGHYAVALDPKVPVGVDIEWKKRRVQPAYVERVFTDFERLGLAEKVGPDYTQRFFEIWTLKEAFWKALDPGFDLAFRDFGFHFDPVRVESPLGREIPWTFGQSHPQSDLQLAVAVAGEREISYFPFTDPLV